MDIINLYDNYNYYFDADLKAIFEQCSKIASEKGFKLYLIGGMVRDLLLSCNVTANEIASCECLKHSQQFKSRNDVAFLDVDITIEGNAIEFASILEKKLDAKILSTHESFGTVKIELQGKKIDLASTRSESYPKKGHLPHVDEIGCSLEKDVLRRDFTVNSLALSLNQDDFADLIDYTSGLEDLKAKKIRVLHDKSFIDDPTRIIRALKYSTRLGFELDEKTLKLQKDYLNNINYDMCYKRTKQEIKKTFEQNSQEAFDKFIEQGIYKLITNRRVGLPSHHYKIEKLINIYNPKHPWIVYFGVLLINIDMAQHSKPASLKDGGLVNPPYAHDSSALNAAPNITFTKYEQEIIEGAKSLINKNVANDFEIYKTFCTQKLETLLILAILGKEKEILHYLDNLAKIKLCVDGNDLIKLGFKPSKKFSEGFDYVLKEKLKNPKITKSEEIELIKSFLEG